MVIPAAEDMSGYTDHNGKFTEEGAEKLRRDTERFYREGAERKAQVYTAVCVVKGRINERIQERSRRAYDALADYLSSDEFALVDGYDSELIAFKLTMPVYRMERAADPEGKFPVIYDSIEYIDDFYNVYMQMLFYFRRLQLSSDESDKEELCAYVKKKKISVRLLAALLADMPLGGKGRIAVRIADLYIRDDKPGDAYYLMLFIEKYCSEGDSDMFTRVKREAAALSSGGGGICL